MESTQEDSEKLIPLNQAIRRRCPDISASPSTWWRWVTKGLAGTKKGERIRLRVQYLGRTPCTTISALNEWLELVTAARMARMQAAPECSDAELEASLADHGLLDAQP